MQEIPITDPRWQTTFPHVVWPRPDEWLPGILLRCDAANGWASRTTLAHLMRVTKTKVRKAWRSDIPNLIVWGKTADYLRPLGQLLALSPQQLRETTYTDELTRLFRLPKINPTMLTMRFLFQVCPACVGDERLLRRRLILPYVQVCPEHDLVLQETCACGAALRIFSKYTTPFCCYQCGMDWGKLPQKASTPEERALAEQLLDWYTFFLVKGSPALVQRALQLIEQHPVRQPERLRESTSASVEVRKRSSYPRQRLPLHLGKLVGSLVERGLTPNSSMDANLTAGT